MSDNEDENSTGMSSTKLAIIIICSVVGGIAAILIIVVVIMHFHSSTASPSLTTGNSDTGACMTTSMGNESCMNFTKAQCAEYGEVPGVSSVNFLPNAKCPK